jgi:hypothetical protein
MTTNRRTFLGIKIVLIRLSALAILLTGGNVAPAQGAAFTYQGRLNDGANPAHGHYDLRFILYDNSAGGSQRGPILTNSATAVSNGLFTATLDFGNQFPGANRWLEIGVRTNGDGGFFTLSPRQPLTPAPYAITADSVVSGGLASGIYGSAVTFSNSANSFNGAFTGSGAGVTNVNAATLDGLSSSNFWKFTGNTVAAGEFLGSVNNQPMDIRVNNELVMRFAYASNLNIITPNIVGGYEGNSVSNGVIGATILGGGATNFPNQVLDNFGAVIGGVGNTTGGQEAVAMGYRSTANGPFSVATGFRTTATGDAAMAMGNQSVASGDYSTALGLRSVAGGFASVALGYKAYANHADGFVWADGSSEDFISTADDQFLIRAAGGVGIGLNNPAAALHVASAGNSPQMQITQNTSGNSTRLRMNVSGSPFWEMDVSGGAAPALQFWNSTLRMAVDYNGNVTAKTFTPSSDRNLKGNFLPVNAGDILEKVAALPLTEWNFKEETTKHIGPMAQDFYAAFGVGADDKHIATVDADGVALAAIQGLNQKLTSELQRKETELTELKQQLKQLTEAVKQLNQKLNGGAQ